MNARRNDDREHMADPQDAMSDLLRAGVEAMENFMKVDWTKDGEKAGVPLSPLMANPAAMMAAATAMSIRMTGQWASAFLNAMQEQSGAGPAEDASSTAGQPVAEAPASEAATDDLKRISGIGPKLAKVLAARGVTGFSALAGMDEQALAALDDELGLDGRVLRDDWAGQAKAILASQG